MITREEAHIECLSRDCHCINGKDRDSNYHEVIDKIYDSFEQHIKELEAQLANTEQLECDGCKWQYYDKKVNSNEGDIIDICYLCERDDRRLDRFEPKDTQ